MRKDCKVAPVIDGGGHERGLRSGTLNVPGIVGLAKSLEVAVAQMDRDITHTRTLRDRIWEALRAVSPSVAVNGPDPIGDRDRRLPNNLHVSISGFEADAIGAALCQVAVSSRSACTSGSERALARAQGHRLPHRRRLPRCASASAAAPRLLTSTTWSISCRPPLPGRSPRPRLATILGRRGVMMVDKELLEILVCPEDKTAVTPADAALLASLNARIREGGVKNRGGNPVTTEIKEGSSEPTGSIRIRWTTTSP